MVRLCFALLFLHKEQDGIDIPRRLMDDLEGEVVCEKLHEGGLGEGINPFRGISFFIFRFVTPL